MSPVPEQNTTPRPELSETERRVISLLTSDVGRITCSACERPAHHVHVTPWITQPEAFVPACLHHDPGGYAIEIRYLRDDWADWKRHLLAKQHGEVTWAVLVEWLAARVG